MIKRLSKGLMLPLVVLLAVLAGCSTSSVPVGDEDEARRIAESYYAMLQNGEIARAAALYKPDQSGHWTMFLEEQFAKDGPLTSYSFKSDTVNTVFSGKFYIFQVGTKYGEKSADEIVTLLLKVNEQDIRIVSHKINPAGARAR